MSAHAGLKIKAAAAISRIWEKFLAGKGWTLAFLLWFGVLLAIFLQMTVHSRPLEQFEPSAGRVKRLMEFWIDYGFFNHAGLSCSDTPKINPQSRVYSSFPPLHYYPEYFVNWLNHTFWGGQKFTLAFHLVINQAFLWITAASAGLLVYRVAKRFNGPPLFALACGITGQAIYHTFPDNLDKIFELMAQQTSSLCLIWFLILEALQDKDRRERCLLFQAVLVLVMAYSDKPIAIPGIILYLMLKALMGLHSHKTFIFLIVAVLGGVGVHALQLGLMKLRFPEIILVGSPFTWRSGLDGATNHVGLLTLRTLGANNAFLRNIGASATCILGYMFIRYRQTCLKEPLVLVGTSIGFYVVPGYIVSQWAMIHPYAHDVFLAIAAILVICAVLIPYIEQKTGHTGLLVWLLMLIAISFSMYQLRVFAIKYPLPFPEPDWRANWLISL